MKIDRFASYVILSFYSLLIVFGIISLMNPSWLQQLSEPGRGSEARISFEQGNQLMYQGAFDKAIIPYTEALNIDTANPNIHGNLAIAYVKTGNFVLADKHLKEVYRLSKGLDSIAFFTYLETRGNLEKAIGFQKVQAGQDGSANFNNSMKYYRDAIQVMPFEANLNYKYAHLAMTLGMDSLAMAEFEKGILKDQNINSYYYAALYSEYSTAMANKENETAEKVRIKINSEEPIPWENYDTITIINLRQKNPQLALALSELGELYMKKGRVNEAETLFKKSTSINPALIKKINDIKKKYTMVQPVNQ
ncbi:MAG: hypothetical protein A2W91_18100 [Bacteroidetes bacterium GWF2_38_335]|nr:MAG: hypothetical protein A2W91_18100 [Bacteroidetes bacterium GWF2_38_335]OFY80120.1 MAG: hypothetical protein A2281_12540 [Bacteroidetes bacterium RIFOXYA12_FULL_38_20]HBS88553.1 hypothetical protein [Bacteroidales bacterium]